MKRAIYAIGVSLMCALPAAAHHGRDFLMVEAYELPHPHTVYFVSSEMFSHASDGTTFTTEPSLLFGVTERFAGEVHLPVLPDTSGVASTAIRSGRPGYPLSTDATGGVTSMEVRGCRGIRACAALR